VSLTGRGQGAPTPATRIEATDDPRVLGWSRVALGALFLLRTTPLLAPLHIHYLADAFPLLAWPDGEARFTPALVPVLPDGVVAAACVARTVAAVAFLIGVATRPAGLLAGALGYLTVWQDPARGYTTFHVLFLGTMLLAPTLLRAPNLLMSGLFATPVAMVLSWLPKGLIDSARPAAILDPASIHVIGLRLTAHNSFPSGHTITAFLVVGVLLAADRTTRPRWPAAAAITLIGMAVAASRIAVGAHWPSDTLAGAGLGLLAGVAGAQAERRWRAAARPAARPLLALVVLACAGTLACIDTGYPLARPLQLAAAAGGAAVATLALWRAWATRSHAARISG